MQRSELKDQCEMVAGALSKEIEIEVVPNERQKKMVRRITHELPVLRNS